MKESQVRLTHHFESSLSHALAGLTGMEFGVAAVGGSPPPVDRDDIFIWQQSLSNVEGPAFWLQAGKDLWDAISRLTLHAAGIEDPGAEDVRSTWQEIVNQTTSGIASSIAGDLACDVAASHGETMAADPTDVSWSVFSITGSEGQTWMIRAAWSEGLASLYDRNDEPEKAIATGSRTASRTFDLLLEMALPVSVSFGRTSLQIREVLKLNTGSIVELDRFVTDPVDVIVNDCIIGRGEVVVVDGNYGVRISQLASREERIRSGTMDASRFIRPL